MHCCYLRRNEAHRYTLWKYKGSIENSSINEEKREFLPLQNNTIGVGGCLPYSARQDPTKNMIFMTMLFQLIF